MTRKKIVGASEIQEVVRTLLCLGQVYTFLSKRGLLVSSTLRALNYAEQCGPRMLSCIDDDVTPVVSSELLRSLSSQVFSAGIVGRPDVSHNYMKIGADLFQARLNNLDDTDLLRSDGDEELGNL